MVTRGTVYVVRDGDKADVATEQVKQPHEIGVLGAILFHGDKEREGLERVEEIDGVKIL